MDYSESGNDHGFIILDLAQDISRARIVDKLKAENITALSLYSRRTAKDQRSLHLVEIDSYLPQEDGRIQSLLARFEDDAATCMSIGGYPVLPFLE